MPRHRKPWGTPSAARGRKPWPTRFGEAATPVARANRQRAPVGASGSLDDIPHRLRLPSCPADRPRNLNGSLFRTFGISPAITAIMRDLSTAPSPPSDLARSEERIHFPKVVVDPLDRDTPFFAAS